MTFFLHYLHELYFKEPWQWHRRDTWRVPPMPPRPHATHSSLLTGPLGTWKVPRSRAPRAKPVTAPDSTTKWPRRVAPSWEELLPRRLGKLSKSKAEKKPLASLMIPIELGFTKQPRSSSLCLTRAETQESCASYEWLLPWLSESVRVKRQWRRKRARAMNPIEIWFTKQPHSSSLPLTWTETSIHKEVKAMTW